jgi:hypothetical protein
VLICVAGFNEDFVLIMNLSSNALIVADCVGGDEQYVRHNISLEKRSNM